MKSPALEERIEFNLLKAARCAEALFIARGHVVRGLFAFFTCFRAFEDYDFAWHRLNGLVSNSIFRGRRIYPLSRQIQA